MRVYLTVEERNAMPSRVALVALACFVLGAARPAGASAVDPVAVYDAVAPAVGVVVAFDADRYPVDSGPGFFVADEDVFVTQLHLLAGASSASVKTASGAYVDVVGVAAFDPATNLVALRTEASGVSPTRLAAASAKVGSRVVLGGSTDGIATAFGLGVIRDTLSDDAGNRFYALDAPVDVWNSGAPVLNEAGAVVGIAGHADSGAVAVTAQTVAVMLAADGQELHFADAAAAAVDAGQLGQLINPARDLPSLEQHGGRTPREKAALLVALALFVVGGYEVATSIAP